MTEAVRAAILEIPDDAWVPALDQDGSERENGEVCEITDRLDFSSWPDGCRVIVRRERPHPGAQLSFTDHDGYRFQAILTDQPDTDIAIIERRHRQRARVEDRIRDDNDTGLAKLPFKAFALNEVWVEIVMLAHDLIVWTQALLTRQSRAETTALPPLPRRRPARVLRTPREAAPPRQLAVDRGAQGRVRETQNAVDPDRLTATRATIHPEQTLRPAAAITAARNRGGLARNVPAETRSPPNRRPGAPRGP